MDETCVLGLDLGTSGVKAVVTCVDGRLLAEASQPLAISRPHPLWSEQNPHDWIKAADQAVQRLREQLPTAQWRTIRALGIAGQMHGAVLLGAEGQVLRPAILWNDGRCQSECERLEAREPATRAITGNRAMAGFTAPKLMWVAAHEPTCFAQLAMVLLPKDYLVHRLSGEYTTDASDASGSLWLDLASRRWSATMLSATGLKRSQLPTVHEGSDCVGTLQAPWASRWGLAEGVQIVAGAGDNAAGAVGVGMVNDGDALVSLGTSGVMFVATETPRPHPGRGLHAFCHALPHMWHQMAVMLSAASALDWWSDLLGRRPEAVLSGLVPGQVRRDAPLFLPYLSGERTPHADPYATASWLGLTRSHGREDLTYAVVEGVSFALADGLDVIREAGTAPERLVAIGGGARSDVWLQQLADVLALPLDRPATADVGPALGAARLAALGLGATAAEVLRPAPLARRFEPSAEAHALYAPRLARYRAGFAPLRVLLTPDPMPALG